MKIKKTYLWILLLATLVSGIHAQQNTRSDLTGPYLGQEPPGTTPRYFAPGVISVDENFEHSAAVFSPDGSEVYWCTNVGRYTEQGRQGMLRLYFMKMIDGKWTAPGIPSFATDIDLQRPTFSPDGNKLYYEWFARPDNKDDVDIFVVERQGDKWSKPAPVSSVINTPAIERLHCVTADGSMYFSRSPFTGHEQMFVSRLVDGTFAEPEKLGKDYNADVAEYALVFGPDEAYMLVCQTAPQGSANVFISYVKADGTWSERIRTPYYSGGFLALSPDGKYLFMENEGICWVSTSFVEELRPE